MSETESPHGPRRAGPPMYTSKTDMVSAMLREMILSGELRGSQALRQRDLALQFNVSQTPVREALRHLESEGLVVGDPHRGVRVAEAAAGEIEENYQIRAALESLGARLAAKSINERQLAHLAQLIEKMRAVGEADAEYASFNRNFHFSIYEAADSPLLLALMRLLWKSMPGGPQVGRSHGESTRQHEALFAALKAGDGDAAADATREHILGTARLFIGPGEVEDQT